MYKTLCDMADAGMYVLVRVIQVGILLGALAVFFGMLFGVIR